MSQNTPLLKGQEYLDLSQPKSGEMAKYLKELENLWDLVSDLVEGGLINEKMIPGDYEKLVNQMTTCDTLHTIVKSNAIKNAVSPIEVDLGEWYINHYRCDDCDEDWEDEWSCGCDDECPSCERPISPHLSKNIA